MADPITEIEILFKQCKTEQRPLALANLRIELTYQLGRLGKMLPDAEARISQVKHEELTRYLELRADKKTIEDAKNTAKWESMPSQINAERQYTLFRQYLANGSEMLNAISSKLRVMELEAKNQV